MDARTAGRRMTELLEAPITTIEYVGDENCTVPESIAAGVPRIRTAKLVPLPVWRLQFTPGAADRSTALPSAL